ncbi:hypothetical protein M0R45_033080 [Rubus argutus]|uniref:Uncharacterized protein n=1 Tax=Rubus argutus TaxID=59490 RepID=A0AAW1WLI0_RUBAR
MEDDETEKEPKNEAVEGDLESDDAQSVKIVGIGADEPEKDVVEGIHIKPSPTLTMDDKVKPTPTLDAAICIDVPTQEDDKDKQSDLIRSGK